MRATINDEYFEWLLNLACGDRYPRKISFRKLLGRLHDIPFRYSIPMDKNRASDGVRMRYKFVLANDYEDDCDRIMDDLDGPCSVFEMILALAIHCEDFMDDTSMGDRTGQWFWGMIGNLGLGSMTDDRFDRRFVDDTIERFLDRDYEPDGKGGLFTIRHCDCDLRDVEIWHQLCWYLNSIM